MCHEEGNIQGDSLHLASSCGKRKRSAGPAATQQRDACLFDEGRQFRPFAAARFRFRSSCTTYASSPDHRRSAEQACDDGSASPFHLYGIWTIHQSSPFHKIGGDSRAAHVQGRQRDTPSKGSLDAIVRRFPVLLLAPCSFLFSSGTWLGGRLRCGELAPVVGAPAAGFATRCVFCCGVTCRAFSIYLGEIVRHPASFVSRTQGRHQSSRALRWCEKAHADIRGGMMSMRKVDSYEVISLRQ